MKLFFLSTLAVLFFISCNQQDAATKENSTIIPAAEKPAAPEDATTIKIRESLRAIETAELQPTSPIKFMIIDSIRYEKVSMKTYYTSEKESLEKNARYSSNKEKTAKALQFLSNKINSYSSTLNIYKVNFFLNALLANTTKYNEMHTKYLNEDMTEIKLVFPM